MKEQEDKFRQREALENLGTNWVDPHIQQLTSVPSHTPPTIPTHPVVGFGCAAGWLLVTLVYCWMKREMGNREWRSVKARTRDPSLCFDLQL